MDEVTLVVGDILAVDDEGGRRFCPAYDGNVLVQGSVSGPRCDD